MSRHSLVRRLSVSFALCLALSACSDGNDNRPDRKPAAVNPVVEGPITAGGGDDCCAPGGIDLRQLGYVPGTPFYNTLNYDVSEVGYRETEYFISGNAISYSNTDELGDDGVWPVEPADAAAFKSRIVVQRPIDDAAFNGTVLVEWFNVSGGLDAAPDFMQMHTEIFREGYVWVGVSSQLVGVEGAPGGLFDLSLKAVDPTRYGSLSHPGDSFSYDIFSQAAQAVRNPVGLDPLGGLEVKRMIAVGESQSAGRLATYFNAIHPTVELFDGFIIHSRGGGSSALSQAPQAEIPTPNPTFERTDLPEPVIGLQTESDLFLLNSITMRQPDKGNYRLWEVAGSAHSDVYTTFKGPDDQGDDPKVADVIERSFAQEPFIECKEPVNDGPGHWVAKASLAALDTWIRTGVPAPSAPWLDVNAAGTAFMLDERGNVTGGIRTPYVDAPVAKLSGEGQPDIVDGNFLQRFCRLFGTTALFDDARMFELYPTEQSYIDRIDDATDAAVNAGFLLPADADLIKDRARTSELGGAP